MADLTGNRTDAPSDGRVGAVQALRHAHGLWVALVQRSSTLALTDLPAFPLLERCVAWPPSSPCDPDDLADLPRSKKRPLL